MAIQFSIIVALSCILPSNPCTLAELTYDDRAEIDV